MINFEWRAGRGGRGETGRRGGREGGRECYISEKCDQQQFEVKKASFSSKYLNILQLVVKKESGQINPI